MHSAGLNKLIIASLVLIGLSDNLVDAKHKYRSAVLDGMGKMKYGKGMSRHACTSSSEVSPTSEEITPIYERSVMPTSMSSSMYISPKETEEGEESSTMTVYMPSNILPTATRNVYASPTPTEEEEETKYGEVAPETSMTRVYQAPMITSVTNEYVPSSQVEEEESSTMEYVHACTSTSEELPTTACSSRFHQKKRYGDVKPTEKPTRTKRYSRDLGDVVSKILESHKKYSDDLISAFSA